MTRTSLTRRQVLLAGAAGGLVASEQLNYAAIARAARVPKASHGAFAHGVAAGYPHPTSTTLWTRVTELTHRATVELEVARDRHFRHVVHRSHELVDPSRDYTVHARVGRLRPDHEYFYRFATKSTHSRVGRFKTLPPPHSKQPLKIGFFSCQSYEAGYYTAHAALAREEDLDLVLCLGDYIYEHHYYEGPASRVDTTGANKDGDVQTLAEYREKYRFYQTDPNLQRLHANHAFVAIWDDHEVEDNYAGRGPDSKPTPPGFENNGVTPRRVPFAERRQNGYDAFFEAMPRIRLRGSRRNRTYGTIRLNGLADLFITDQRQYRSPQACDDKTLAPCAEENDPKRTMLGAAQKKWFKRAVTGSDARWKLWASEVMIMSLDAGLGQHANPDQWDGYAAERKEIFETFRHKRVKNLVGLTGDIHTFAAGNITTNGNITGKPVGTELVGGSVTSFGLPEETGISAEALEGLRKASDKHILYADFERRGYCVVHVHPKELTAQFKSPDTIAAPTSPVRTIGRFRVKSGVPKLEVL
jgi:alkaline phosphatase D